MLSILWWVYCSQVGVTLHVVDKRLRVKSLNDDVVQRCIVYVLASRGVFISRGSQLGAVRTKWGNDTVLPRVELCCERFSDVSGCLSSRQSLLVGLDGSHKSNEVIDQNFHRED